MTITPSKIETLLQQLANATTTAYQAGGHSKAARNEAVAQEIKDELTQLGVEIPEDKELLKVGVFNGPGSV